MYVNRSMTLTYGDCAENHQGMQALGQIDDTGYSLEDFLHVSNVFGAEIYCLNQYLVEPKKLSPKEKEIFDKTDQAYVMIIRNGVNLLLEDIDKTADDLFMEQNALIWDQKAFMRGRVVNKRARYNLCYSDEDQEPDYENKKGRVYSFSNPKITLTSHIRTKLSHLLNKGKLLQCEGNYYYDNSLCGIGYHGDTERKKVIAIKLGDVQPMYYYWYHKNERISNRMKIELNHGDIYVMSEKTTGFDWKKSSLFTLRHATGMTKFIE